MVNSATSKPLPSQKEQTIGYNNNKSTLPNSVSRQDFWADFKDYLVAQGQSKNSIKDKLSYARRFCYVLEKKNAQDLLKLPYNPKNHAMKALASLSKFLGKYDQWLDIVKKYQLKWADSNKSINVFKSIFNSESEGKNLELMIRWIKDVSAILPQEYKNIILFNTLTGLRPNESQRAIHLIKIKENEYVDREKGILKHYQFPEIFLRQTKNA